MEKKIDSSNLSTRFHPEKYLKTLGWKGYGYGFRDDSLIKPLQLPMIRKTGLGQDNTWWTHLFNTRLESLGEIKQEKKVQKGLYKHFVQSKEKK